MILVDQLARNRLVIYPVDMDYTGLVAESLEKTLFEVGLSNKGRPGSRFMQCLTFVGCSPSVNSEQDSVDYNQYSLGIVSTGAEKTLLTRENVRAPLCPWCSKQKKEEFAYTGIRETETGIHWICPACGKASGIQEINWRHKLAIASIYIVVHGVFEGEALPSDKLLDQLSELTGVEWSYCYC